MKIPFVYAMRDIGRYQNPINFSLMKKNEAAPTNSILPNRAPPNQTETLRAKLKSGQKLSPSEMEYLKSNDPELYGKALKVEQERNAYDKTIKRSRTKTEANEHRDQTIMSIIRPITKGDPDETLMRVNAIQDVHRTFTRSIEYASLDWK